MELSEAVRRRAERAPGPRRRSRAGLLIAAVGALMVVVYAAAFLGVMRLEGHDFSWISAVYWTITTMSTLGYGDVTFESDLGRLLSIIVLLSGVVYMLVLLPFFVIQYVVTPWLDRRRMARTPRKVPALLRDHVLLVGSDAVTQAFAARAERSRVPAVLVVEDPVEAGLLHDQGRQVVVGPLDSAQTYRNAGADRARLVASTLSDTANTNVAFTVRQVSGDVPVAVTASKPVSTDVLSLAGSDHVLELGAVLGREMAGRVLGTTGRVHRIGSFGETIIAEAAARGTALVGLTLEQAIGELRCCVRILALLRKGRLRPMKPESTITDSTVLILAGEAPELAAYDEQFQVHEQSEDPVIILGGGRVGRSASRELTAQGLPNTIVEQLPGRVENSYSALEGTASYRVIDGDAADQRILRRAGLESASAVLVTPRDDDLNVYLTLFCRRLRPELQVVSRATYERNVATLYRAGADGVLSYATIGATDLWNHAGLSHRVLVAEGNELFLVPRPCLPGATVRARCRGAPPHGLPHRRRGGQGRHPQLRHRVDPVGAREAAAARRPPRRAAVPPDLSEASALPLRRSRRSRPIASTRIVRAVRSAHPAARSPSAAARPALIRRILRRDMTAAPVKLALGDQAPDFDLPTAGGGRVSLSELRGAPALLWFYPAANTSLCTKQACDLRDNHQMFLDAGYRVVGISPDPIAELDRFVEKQELPYTLAGDESHQVMEAYGAWGEKNMYGKKVQGTIRSTFAIDAEGILTFVKYRVGTPKHIALLQEKLGL